jgi:hypothetical protein
MVVPANMAVAMEAGKGQVPWNGMAAVLTGDDVVNGEKDGWVKDLGHPAILTGVACPLPHLLC